MLNSAQSPARSRSAGIHQFVGIRYRSKVSPTRAEDQHIPLNRRQSVHRRVSARFTPGYCVSSLLCNVSIRREEDEASSAGVRFIRSLFPDSNPRHPYSTSLPGPACLVHCQQPAKVSPRSTRHPQTTQATCLFPVPCATLLQGNPKPIKICIPKTPALKIMLFCSSATLNLEQLKIQFALRNIQFVCRCFPLKSRWVIGAGRAHGEPQAGATNHGTGWAGDGL